MYYGKVELSGVKTAGLKTLSESEKEELLLKARNGDEKAREELINGNLRLVLSVVQRFASRGENMDDLFQVGCIGLIKAIDHFDPHYFENTTIRLSTYAVPLISGEIRRFLRDSGALHVSRSIRDLAYKAIQKREMLSRKLSRDATVEEIVTALNEEGGNYSAEDVTVALDSVTQPVSLFETVYSDGGGDAICLMDQISDNEGADEQWTDQIALRDAMEKLGQRELSIVTLRYFGGKTQMEIAEEIGISQAQVSRLEKAALTKLRKYL